MTHRDKKYSITNQYIPVRMHTWMKKENDYCKKGDRIGVIEWKENNSSQFKTLFADRNGVLIIKSSNTTWSENIEYDLFEIKDEESVDDIISYENDSFDNTTIKLKTIIEEIDNLKTILEYNDYLNSFELTSKVKQARKVEIQNKVKDINLNLSKFNDNLDHILRDVNQDFNFELFIDSLMSKSTFDEVNPRILKEKELEKIRIKEEKLKTAWEESEEFKRIEFVKYLNISNRSFLKKMYYDGPEDIEKLKFLIDRGLDVSDSIYPVIRLIERGRTIGFIQFLIQNGLKLNRNDIKALKDKNFLSSQDFLKTVYDAKQIDNSIVNEILQ